MNNLKTCLITATITLVFLSSCSYRPSASAIAPSQDNSFFLATTGMKLYTCAIDSGKITEFEYSDFGYIDQIALSPDGMTALSASKDYAKDLATITIWDVATSKPVTKIDAHDDTLIDMLFAPDSLTFYSSSSDNQVKHWQTSDGQLIKIFDVQVDCIGSLAISPDNRLLAACADESIVLWNSATGQINNSIKLSWLIPNSISFSNDGTIVMVCCSQRLTTSGINAVNQDYLQLWDINTMQRLSFPEKFKDTVYHGIFLPGDQSLLTVGYYYDKDYRYYVQQVDLIKEQYSRIGNPYKVPFYRIQYSADSFAFARDGSFALSQGDNPVVDLWDLQQNKIVKSFDLPVDN